MLKAVLLTAALLLLGLTPTAAACVGGGALGAFCAGSASGPTSGGGTFDANWSWPSVVDTDSSEFVVSVLISTSASGQTLNLPAGSTSQWTFAGCAFVSEVTNTVVNVVKAANVKVAMSGPRCTMSLMVWTSTVVSGTTSVIPITMQVMSMSLASKVTLAGTVANQVTGTLTVSDDANGWATHQDPLSGEIKLCGQTGVCGPIDTTANTTVHVSNTNITEAQQMAVTMPGFGGLGFDGFLLSTLWLIAFWVLLRRAKGAASFAALLGFLNEWLVIMPGSRVYYVLFFVLTLWLEAVVGDRMWSRWVNRTKDPESEPT